MDFEDFATYQSAKINLIMNIKFRCINSYTDDSICIFKWKKLNISFSDWICNKEIETLKKHSLNCNAELILKN